MSLNVAGLDGVRVLLALPVAAVDTTITFDAANSPYKNPPDPGVHHYYLTLIDFVNRPEAWERVKVTGITATTLTVERNVASSNGVAQDFAVSTVAQWTCGVNELTESKGKVVLSSGGHSDAYLIPETWAGAPLYFSPSGTPYDAGGGLNSSRNGEAATRWYNTTGADLTVNDFFIYTHDHQVDDKITFEVYLDGASTGMILTFLNTGGINTDSSERTTLNPVLIPDGSYISVNVDTSLFQTAGDFFYIANMQLVLS